MRNFGNLNGRFSREMSAQAGFANYVSPDYLQQDVGYPYGTYGTTAPPPGAPQQPNVTYAYYEQGPGTSKTDVQVAAIQQGGQVATSFFSNLFGYKTAQLSAQSGYVPPGTTVTTTSGSSGSSSSAVPLIIGLTVVGVLGVGAFMAFRG